MPVATIRATAGVAQNLAPGGRLYHREARRVTTGHIVMVGVGEPLHRLL